MNKETWLPVPEYEGIYSVSDLGNVMSMNFANTGMLKILKPGKQRGYLKVDLYKNAVCRTFSVHKLVLLAFKGEANGMQRNHISGVKTDNRLVNLEYCTASENTRHSFRIGLQSNVGEKHSHAKLNDEKVIDIRARLKSGETQMNIAKDLGVCQPTISKIASGAHWSHIAFDRKAG